MSRLDWPARRACILIAMVALGGCATVSPDAGVDAVQTLARERIGNDATIQGKTTDPAATAAATRAILGRPLTAEAAVQLALLHNPALRASLAELGVGEADVIQAARLPNPHFSFSNKGAATSPRSNAR